MSFNGAANFNPDIPVCNPCMLLTTNSAKKDYPWKCPRCGDFDTNFSLSEYDLTNQRIIRLRSLAYESRLSHTADMKIEKIVYRRFMFFGDPREPNERYRPWLEKNVGKQGEAWNWNIAPSPNFDLLEIEFSDSEHALLFELSCP